MENMKDIPENKTLEANRYDRRKMLSVLGITGLSAISANAVANQEGKKKAGKRTSFLFYNNVSEMKQDNSLKEGDWVQTSGFYEAGDGGNAEYQIIKTSEKPDEGAFIGINNGLIAELANVARINYKMFGAKSDGKSDDGIQIRNAHNYANRKNIPVENLYGNFWIEKSNNISIQTDVNWGKSAFYINEKYNTNISRFRISGRQTGIKINLTDNEKQSFLKQLKSGAKNISELSAYANCLVIIIDSKSKAGARQGGNAHEGKAQQEFFYVEEYGRIIGDIFLEFSDYTSLTAYPTEESYLTIEGGTFFLSGDGTGEQNGSYMANGIQIQRSRTIIKNQWVGLEKGKKDTALRPRSGFYNLSRVYDVQLENIRLIPWEKTRGSKETNVPQGTYGISGSVMMNVLFRNITAEGDNIHWGIFGTNYVKNLTVERCFLNRFDVHSFGWNITITDSEIGQKGLTVTGGGELRLENTACYNNTFISFRNDYGARWDGNILLRNCRLYPFKAGVSAILQYGAKDLDYKYAIGYGNKIKIEDFVIDYKSNSESTSICWIMNAVSVSSYAQSGKLFFPSEIEVKNVTVKGRTKGVRLMNISKPNTYLLQKDFLYNSFDLNSNARLIFENIHLEKSNLGSVHFSLAKQPDVLDNNALVPFIRFKDCENLVCDLGANPAVIEFENCVISHLNLSPDDKYRGSVLFQNCKFRAYSDKISISPGSILGTSFVNCILMLPEQLDSSVPAPLSVYKFIEINKFVKYNHINTRLGQDVLSWCKNRKITLSPEFINKLKSHHELED